MFLLLAFIYPPTLAEAKENTLNNVLNEQSVDAETNLVGDKNEEILLAHRRICKRYRRHRRTRKYYHRNRNRRHYYKRSHRYRRYYGQPYRHGRWKRVRDHYGRSVYEWKSYY
ncbi:hypothetical protein [Fortiea sp. LEGE XX443]|nr:hypothetical protein [Fortiea sp. LEGE XX443]